ncbi:hypothetical protein CEXT_593261 [Caerostris extrusa]|uniref:Uncharacterized protein n=1 Tax=Caerostris extrusa TaxID=172846 RepID=A0AAV4SZD3_CAEEX|nr:hypothetical protein CEXT_593261 [Caerostris extrusa]
MHFLEFGLSTNMLRIKTHIRPTSRTDIANVSVGASSINARGFCSPFFLSSLTRCTNLTDLLFSARRGEVHACIGA